MRASARETGAIPRLRSRRGARNDTRGATFFRADPRTWVRVSAHPLSCRTSEQLRLPRFLICSLVNERSCPGADPGSFPAPTPDLSRHRPRSFPDADPGSFPAPTPIFSRRRPRIFPGTDPDLFPAPTPDLSRRRPRSFPDADPGSFPAPTPIFSRRRPRIFPGTDPDLFPAPTPDLSRRRPRSFPGADPGSLPAPTPIFLWRRPRIFPTPPATVAGPTPCDHSLSTTTVVRRLSPPVFGPPPARVVRLPPAHPRRSSPTTRYRPRGKAAVTRLSTPGNFAAGRSLFLTLRALPVEGPHVLRARRSGAVLLFPSVIAARSAT